MSETKLRAFAERAELLVDVPDLSGLERRGRALRTRRQALLVAAAVVLALVGTWVVRDSFPKAEEPTRPVRPEPGLTQPYPGNNMQDLAAGTYEVEPSSVLGEPTALITLPEGWNDWEGPNRFNGHRPGDPTTGRYNETALARSTWMAGVLVVKVLAVADRVCESAWQPDNFVDTVDETVSAIARLPGHRIVGGPESVDAFGYRSVHLALRMAKAARSCDQDAWPYWTSRNGLLSAVDATDVWVVDVDGVPVTVMAWTEGDVPPRIRAEMKAIVESVQFVVHE
jgi:hypothetical protein